MFGRKTSATLLVASLAGVALLGGCRGEATTGNSDIPSSAFAANIRLQAGDLQTGPVVRPLANPLTVRVVDAGGQPVSGASVNWAVMAGGGTVNPPTGISNAAGLVTTVWTLGTDLGDQNVRAYLTRGFALDSVSFKATATVGAPVVILFDESTRPPATAVVGTTVSGMKYQVRDSLGNPVAGARVAFSASAGSGVVLPDTATTDAGGFVTVQQWTLPNLVGLRTMNAVLVGGGPAPSVAVQTTPGAGRVLTVVNPGGTTLPSGVAGSSLSQQIAVSVQDQFGNIIVGEPVNFADSLSPGVTVTPATSTTGVDGTAQATVTLGEQLGPAAVRVRIAEGTAGQVRTFTSAATMTFRDVYAGNYFACGVGTNDRAYCWGFGQDGQLGTGATVNLPGPRTAVITTTGAFLTVREISGGDSHTCALSIARSVSCWGANPDNRHFGVAGASLTARVITTPAALGSIRSIATGETFSCAVTMGGIPYCYGLNERGQLGGPGGLVTTASPIPALWSHVVTGGRHACGMPRSNLTLHPDSAGRLWCWGANDEGQLGAGDLVDRLSASLVTRAAAGINFDSTSVVAGEAHTCALENGTPTANRQAWCWGSNAFGQLGADTTSGPGARVRVPVPVVGTSTFVRLYAAEHHTCGLQADGSAFCWGRNHRGQLGTGNQIDQTRPAASASAFRFRNLALGELFTCGLAGSGTPGQVGTPGSAGVIHCWGDNEYGQLGTGSFSGNGTVELAPQKVSGQQ